MLRLASDATSLLYRQRTLIRELARREIADRYAGQMFGGLWTILHPLFVMALYVFVFAVVFRTRIGGTYEMPLDYVTYLLAGLIPWLAIQDSMSKGCVAITANANLVKQVVFPVEVLPFKSVLASVIPQMVSLGLLVAYVVIKHGRIQPTYLLLPVLLLIQIVMMAGLAYVLAALGTYFKDLKDVVQIFATGGVYLLPIFYLPEWVPELFKPLLYLNPFSYVIWCYQDILYFGRIEHPYAWPVSIVFAFLLFAIGFGLFRKVKTGFGNVL